MGKYILFYLITLGFFSCNQVTLNSDQRTAQSVNDQGVNFAGGCRCQLSEGTLFLGITGEPSSNMPWNREVTTEACQTLLSKMVNDPQIPFVVKESCKNIIFDGKGEKPILRDGEIPQQGRESPNPETSGSAKCDRSCICLTGGTDKVGEQSRFDCGNLEKSKKAYVQDQNGTFTERKCDEFFTITRDEYLKGKVPKTSCLNLTVVNRDHGLDCKGIPATKTCYEINVEKSGGLMELVDSGCGHQDSEQKDYIENKIKLIQSQFSNKNVTYICNQAVVSGPTGDPNLDPTGACDVNHSTIVVTCKPNQVPITKYPDCDSFENSGKNGCRMVEKAYCFNSKSNQVESMQCCKSLWHTTHFLRNCPDLTNQMYDDEFPLCSAFKEGEQCPYGAHPVGTSCITGESCEKAPNGKKGLKKRYVKCNIYNLIEYNADDYCDFFRAPKKSKASQK